MNATLTDETGLKTELETMKDITNDLINEGHPEIADKLAETFANSDLDGVVDGFCNLGLNGVELCAARDVLKKHTSPAKVAAALIEYCGKTPQRAAA